MPASSTSDPVTTTAPAFGKLTIGYDATTKSYTLTETGGASTFQPAPYSVVSTDGSTTTYRVSAPVSSGMPGPPDTYTQSFKQFIDSPSNPTLPLKYVTYGEWDSDVQRLYSEQDTRRYATYGIGTDAASMPKTGTASYTGVGIGYGHNPNASPGDVPLSVTGNLGVDFGSGAINTNLVLTNTLPSSVLYSANLSGTGTISSGTNQYSGSFGNGASGSFAGAFYGPAAQETGYTFNATDTKGAVAVGAFVGTQAPGHNVQMPATVSQTFAGPGVVDSSNLFASPTGTAMSGPTNGALSIAFDATANSYTVSDGTSTQTFAQSDKQLVTTTNFTIFEKQKVQTSGGDTLSTTDSFALPNSGAANSALALNYVNYGVWQTDYVDAGVSANSTHTARYGLIGVPTLPALMPVAALATYKGAGRGSLNGFGIYTSGSLTADFLKGTLGVTLVLDNSTIPASSTYHNVFNGTGAIASGTSNYSGTFGGTATGTFLGGFYGPDAQETGYSFALTDAAGNKTDGVFVAKQAATVFPSQSAAFGSSIGFPAGEAPATTAPSYGVTTIGYDASTGSYALSAGDDAVANGDTLLLSQSDLVHNGKDYRIYQTTRTGRTDTFTALVDAPANPAQALNYVSYGLWETLAQPLLGAQEDLYRYEVNGTETTAVAVPTTGGSTYTGIGDAIANTATGSVHLNGTGTLTANFATGALATALTLTNGGNTYSDSLTGSGTISSGSHYSGSFGGTASGRFLGGFYGSAVQETGYTFNATDSSGNVLAGAFVGKGVPTTNLSLPPIVNQSFATSSVEEDFSYSGGKPTSPTQLAPAFGQLTIAYDANAQSYTLTDATGKFTANPANSVGLSGSTQAYGASGTTTVGGSTANINDSVRLFLDNASNSALPLNYVTYGVWNTVISGSGLSSYQYRYGTGGIDTSAANVPTRGTAVFNGLGEGYVTGLPGGSLNLNVMGNLSVNFASGALNTALRLTSANRYVAYDMSVTGSGAITSGTNQYGGTFNGAATGSFAGGFYGPIGQETGYTFLATDSSGDTSIGAFVGGLVPTGANSAMLPTATETFPAFAATYYSSSGGAVLPTLTTEMQANQLYGVTNVTYNSTTNTYTISDGAYSASFGPSELSSSTGQYNIYRKMVSYDHGLLEGNSNDYFGVFNNGPSNPALVLTYVTYAYWQTPLLGDSITGYSSADRYAVFGVMTPSGGVPTTGTATYHGVGAGWTKIPTPSGSQSFGVKVTGTLDANFASGALNTALTASNTSLPAPWSDSYTGTGTITAGTSQYSGAFGNGATGSFTGGFYGPAAQETGYSFVVKNANSSAIGVFVGKK